MALAFWWQASVIAVITKSIYRTQNGLFVCEYTQAETLLLPALKYSNNKRAVNIRMAC